MGDTFCEVLIEKKQTGSEKARKGLMIFVTVLFFLAGFLIHPLALLLFAVMGIVDYVYIPRFNIEYEYSYINGQIDIDRIFSRSKRKKYKSYDMAKMEICAPLKSHRLDYQKNNTSLKIVDCSSGIEEGHIPFAFIIKGDAGSEFVIIEPNAEMLKDMKTRFPRKVFVD